MSKKSRFISYDIMYLGIYQIFSNNLEFFLKQNKIMPKTYIMWIKR